MKFRIISSIVIVGAILLAIILSGGLEFGSSSPSTKTNNDGIRINP